MTGDQDYFDLVKKVKPSVLAVTEGDPKIEQKRKQAAEVHAELIAIPKIHTPSTSQLAKLLGLE